MYRTKGDNMTLITMTEFKNDLKKYTELAKDEDVIITKNGKPHIKLVSIAKGKMDIVYDLAGSLPSDLDYEEILKERYSKI